MQSNRLTELDSLRGLAALAVVLFHYTTRYDELFSHEKTGYTHIEFGHLGVNLFFMLSGFVIFMTLTSTPDALTFAKKRAIRLYPAYIVAVILTYIAVKLYNLEGRGVSFWEAVVNLTMLQGHIPNVGHVDGAYWSLTVELTFYAIVAIALFMGITKKPLLFSSILLAIGVLVKTLNSLADHRVTSLLEAYTISNFLHLFVAGIMFYLIREKENMKHYIFLAICLGYQFSFNDLPSSLVIAAFFLIFFLLVKNKMKFLNYKPLVFLGTISYSFYLLHQNIGYIIINQMEKIGLTHEIFIIIPLALTIGLATLLTFYVEKPVGKLLNQRLRPAKVAKDSRVLAK